MLSRLIREFAEIMEFCFHVMMWLDCLRMLWYSWPFTQHWDIEQLEYCLLPVFHKDCPFENEIGFGQGCPSISNQDKYRASRIHGQFRWLLAIFWAATSLEAAAEKNAFLCPEIHKNLTYQMTGIFMRTFMYRTLTYSYHMHWILYQRNFGTSFPLQNFLWE